MVPSLYDDLDDLVKKPSFQSNKPAPNVGLRVTGLWSDESSKKKSASSSLKMMQAQIAARKAQLSKQQQSNSSSSIVAPVVDLSAGPSASGKSRVEGQYRFNQRTGKMERASHSSTKALFSLDDDFASPFVGLENEYNPLCPNDYEEIAKQMRLEKIKNRESRRASGALSLNYPSSESSSDSKSESDEEAEEIAKRAKAGRGSFVAPPPILIQESVPAKEAQAGPATTPAQGDSSKFGAKNNVAAKMMAKMGYREGQGLGREGQGMSTALYVEKTGHTTGKIVHERDRPKPGQVEVLAAMPLVNDDEDMDLDGDPLTSTDPLPYKSSRVVLLRNMCGPGEVDHDLEPETAEECAKYGKVVSCMIYEIMDVPEDEAVRIFVEFADIDSAVRAVLDLNGRFFGGRIVKANFYDADKFTNLEFGENPLL